MIERLRITVLADNYAAAADVLAEHGLSMLIEADGHRILFDTGQGRVLRGNADALGVRLSEIDAVVVSHGHYDHTGGLAEALADSAPSAIFLHPAALEPKYARAANPPHRNIGIPERSREALQKLGERIVLTRSVAEVAPGVWCTGEIPRLPANGPVETGFFLDPDCRVPDPMADDQALFMETAVGLVVIAGCAHAGVANTLDGVAALTGAVEIHTLAGGLHLGRATRRQLEAASGAIDERNVRVLAPCHCTGMGAHAYLRARFGAIVRDAGAGTELVLGEP